MTLSDNPTYPHPTREQFEDICRRYGVPCPQPARWTGEQLNTLQGLLNQVGTYDLFLHALAHQAADAIGSLRFDAVDAKVAAAALDAQAWQPISSAPKDGTPILGGKVGEARWAFWSLNSQAWCRLGAGQETHWEPTHWMPLPAPPLAADQGKDGE